MAMKFLRQPVVEDISGLSGSTIWNRVSQGKFPKPIKIGVQAVAWIDLEVYEWQKQMIEASRGSEKKEGEADDDEDEQGDHASENESFNTLATTIEPLAA